MPDARKRIRLDGWKRGIVRKGPPSATPADGFWQAKNVYLDDAGAIRLRPGKRRWKTLPLGPGVQPSHRIPGLVASYQKTVGTEGPRLTVIGERQAVPTIRGQMWAWRAGQRGPDNPNWHQLADNLKVSGQASAVTIQDMLVIGYSRIQPPLMWDSRFSTVARALVTAPDGNIVGNYQDRLLVGGSGTEPNVIALSAPGAFSDFREENGAAFLKVGAGAGDRVVAVDTSFFGEGLIYKTRSLSRLSGTSSDITSGDPLRIKLITDKIGTLGQGTTVRYGDDLFWLSERGVHSLRTTERFGDMETHDLSNDISELYRQIPQDELEEASSVFDPHLGLVYFCMPAQTLVFDPRRPAWYIWDIKWRGAATVYIDGVGTVVFGLDDEGHIFSLEPSRVWDDGAADEGIPTGYVQKRIEPYIESGEISPDDKGFEFNWKAMRIHQDIMGTGRFELGYITDRDFRYIANKRNPFWAIVEINPFADAGTIGDSIGWDDAVLDQSFFWGLSERAGQEVEVDKTSTSIRWFLRHEQTSDPIGLRIHRLDLDYLEIAEHQEIVRVGIEEGP